MSYNDPLTMLIRYVTQTASLLVYLAGFAVFFLIWRITKDRAYFLLGLGMGIYLVIGVVHFFMFTLFGPVSLSQYSVLLNLYAYAIAPVVRLVGSAMLLVGFVMLGKRAVRKFRRPTNKPPDVPPDRDSLPKQET